MCCNMLASCLACPYGNGGDGSTITVADYCRCRPPPRVQAIAVASQPYDQLTTTTHANRGNLFATALLLSSSARRLSCAASSWLPSLHRHRQRLLHHLLHLRLCDGSMRVAAVHDVVDECQLAFVVVVVVAEVQVQFTRDLRVFLVLVISK